MGPIARSIAAAALFCAASIAPAVSARAEAPAAAPPAGETAAEATPADLIDADAVALLKGFGDLLEAQPRFSFSVDFSYEVVQADAQKLEFGATRVYTVRRPDRLRIDEERRVGGKRELLFDGNQLAVYVPGDNAYALAKLKKHHDLDSMLDLVRDALDLPVPLGDLLRADPLKRIEEGLTSAYIVGRERLAGVECDHLAWRTDEVDAEAWFTAGEQPLLQRVVIHYRDLAGQPSFRAQFTSWNRSPEVADSVFAFTPPADAERLPFTVRGRNVQPTEEQEP
jgi:hypothetical protein